MSQCSTGLFFIIANQRISLENLKFGNYLRHCVQDFTTISLSPKVVFVIFIRSASLKAFGEVIWALHRDFLNKNISTTSLAQVPDNGDDDDDEHNNDNDDKEEEVP